MARCLSCGAIYCTYQDDYSCCPICKSTKIDRRRITPKRSHKEEILVVDESTDSDDSCEYCEGNEPIFSIDGIFTY